MNTFPPMAMSDAVAALIREREAALKTADDAHRDAIESMLLTDYAARDYILRYRNAAAQEAEATCRSADCATAHFTGCKAELIVG